MVNLLLRGNVYSAMFFVLLSGIIWFAPVPNFPNTYTFLGITFSKYIGLIIAYIINILAGVIFNRALSKQFFSNENTIAVLFFYMLLTALSTKSTHSIGLAFLSLIFSIFILFILGMREDENKVRNIFNSSFLLGAIGLINIFFIPFIYLIATGIRGVRRIVLKDILTILVALLAPFYLVWAFSFLTDNYQFLATRFQLNFSAPIISTGFIVSAAFIFSLAITGIFALKNNRLVFGTKILRVSNTLIFLFIISYVLAFLGLFFIDSQGFFSWVAASSAIFISTLFLKIEFQFKDALLILLIMFLIGFKFLV